jgi:hypothetical protein
MQRRAVLFQESKHWGTAGTAQRRWTQPCDCRLARAVKRSAPCAETDELRNKTSSVIKCPRHLSGPQMKSGSKKLKDQNRWQLWLFIASNAVRVLGNDRASGFKAALAGMAKLLPCGVADDVRSRSTWQVADGVYRYWSRADCQRTDRLVDSGPCRRSIDRGEADLPLFGAV